MLVFEERGKPEYPEKNLLEQGEDQQQIPSKYNAGFRNQTRATPCDKVMTSQKLMEYDEIFGKGMMKTALTPTITYLLQFVAEIWGTFWSNYLHTKPSNFALGPSV